MRPIAAAGIVCLLLLTGSWCYSPATTVTIHFVNRIGTEKMQLGEPYCNSLGDTITINRFRYYVSNFAVTSGNGKTVALAKDYFLVDEADSASQIITLTVPAGATGIEFLLGVDSIRNVTGVQTGALDPLHGMFWTWNSGYIMAKLEGTSNVSKAPGRQFTYHIGGFNNGNSAARKIRLQVTAEQLATGNLPIAADVNAWFNGTYPLRIAETPVCHGPGALANHIADNYSTMFSLLPVRQ